MKKWFKFFLTSVFVLMMGATVFAADDSAITVNKSWDLEYGKYSVKEFVFFSGIDPGGTWTVYNDDHGSSTTDGQVAVRNMDLDKTIQIHVQVLGSTNIYYTIEGNFGTDSSWAMLFDDTITAAHSVGSDTVIPIAEWCDNIRVGLKSGGSSGVDEVYVTGSMRGGRWR